VNSPPAAGYAGPAKCPAPKTGPSSTAGPEHRLAWPPLGCQRLTSPNWGQTSSSRLSRSSFSLGRRAFSAEPSEVRVSLAPTRSRRSRRLREP
jgi:hypothetical protein